MKLLSQLVRFIVTGTERTDLSTLPNFKGAVEEENNAGQSDPSNAPELLLEALSSAVLLDKANVSLLTSAEENRSQTAYDQLNAPKFPSTAAICTLERILHHYPDQLLLEWLAKVEAKGYSLPPEYLPDLLDRALRNPTFCQALQCTNDKRLRWLAAQNPQWSAVFPDLEKADWFTADFNTRLSLLKDARDKRPLVALSLLEKTWPEENNDHKMAFLAVFQDNLSAFDEALLQKALLSKSRELRFLSAGLLAQIPESQFFSELLNIKARLTPFVITHDFAAFLQLNLPDVSEAAFKTLANLINVKETDTLRTGILLLYLNFAPPSWLSESLNLSPDMILQLIHQDPDKHFTLSGIIHSATLHRDVKWIRAFLTFLSRHPTHPLWKSTRVEQAISCLPDHVWNVVLSELCPQYPLLEHYDQAPFKVLLSDNRIWPQNVLRALLSSWYERAQSRFNYNSTIWLPLLRSAALHCIPADALEMSTWLTPQVPLSQPAARDLDVFWDMVKLRQRMAFELI